MDKKYDFLNSDEMMFKLINENSLKKRQQVEQERVKEEEYHLKQEKKEKFRKRLRNLLILVAMSAIIVASAPKVTEVIDREIELRQANEYMDIAIDFVAPDVERGVLSDGTVILIDNNSTDYKKIADTLQSKFGLTRDCAIYCISEKYGHDAFNKLVNEYGYENTDDFLYKCYAIATDTSSSGKTIYGKKGSYKYFENCVQIELVDKVEEIQNYTSSKSIENGGLKK